jgi:hypothetical protein
MVPFPPKLLWDLASQKLASSRPQAWAHGLSWACATLWLCLRVPSAGRPCTCALGRRRRIQA